MIKISRSATPDILRDAKVWGIKYCTNKEANPSYVFQWKTRNGKKINEHIMPLLKAMTADHCAYCDGYPVGQMSVETIDHFRPKSTYPKLAYYWINLFLCCSRCQAAKKENYSRKLLKPDKLDYDFNRFFIINFASGQLQANPFASDKDKEMANYTINLLELNAKDICIFRRREIEHFDLVKKHKSEYFIDDFSYRYLFLGDDL